MSTKYCKIVTLHGFTREAIAMESYSLRNLSKQQKENFYQSKYDYYRVFNTGLIIVATIVYLSYFFTDCGIFGRFAYETVFSRLLILVPFFAYLILSKRVRNYRIMVPCSYLMIHAIIWFTDWSTYLLPDRQHAITGMVIMNLIFVCAGFCAPLKYSIPAHAFMVVDIAVADLFIHYDNIQMMYLFNIPCIVAVCAMHYLMQRVYLEQYITKGKLQSMVVLDQLTEVYNRNIMKEISNVSTGELVFPHNADVSVMLMDIDFFKNVNDRYGHEAGDKVLVSLAQILKTMVRVTDYVIRWGGEEFLIIMPGCPLERALEIAEKIRQKVEQDENGICRITVSIGVSCYQGGDYHTVISEADEAMYQAKNRGRNCVVPYSS